MHICLYAFISKINIILKKYFAKISNNNFNIIFRQLLNPTINNWLWTRYTIILWRLLHISGTLNSDLQSESRDTQYKMIFSKVAISAIQIVTFKLISIFLIEISYEKILEKMQQLGKMLSVIIYRCTNVLSESKM